jgi:hypothetical protein
LGAPSSPNSFDQASWCKSIRTSTPAERTASIVAWTRPRYASSYESYEVGWMPLQLIGRRSASKPKSRIAAASSAVNAGIGSSGNRPSSKVTSNTPCTRAFTPRRNVGRPLASTMKPQRRPSGLPTNAGSEHGAVDVFAPPLPPAPPPPPAPPAAAPSDELLPHPESAVVSATIAASLARVIAHIVATLPAVG